MTSLEAVKALLRGATCAICGSAAACMGNYPDGAEDDGTVDFACDNCCGHGNEDGWCLRIDELVTRRDDRDDTAELRAELDRYGGLSPDDYRLLDEDRVGLALELEAFREQLATTQAELERLRQALESICRLEGELGATDRPDYVAALTGAAAAARLALESVK